MTVISEDKTRDQVAGMRCPQAAIISEPGLYKLLLRSDKAEAKAFQGWVTRVRPWFVAAEERAGPWVSWSPTSPCAVWPRTKRVGARFMPLCQIQGMRGAPADLISESEPGIYPLG